MCNFVSAIITKSGELICRPGLTDSHDDLILSAGLKDNGGGGFVRLEFLPPEDHGEIGDISRWRFKVDQQDTPEWFDGDSAREALAGRVRRMFISDHKKILLGGCWILLDGANVDCLRSGRVAAMIGAAKLSRVRGNASVTDVWDNASVTGDKTVRKSNQDKDDS